jgi:hypothetical protein
VVIEATPEMLQEAALLSTNGAVAWIDGMTQGVSLGSVQRAVAAASNALTNDVCVVKHHPEQYFITFIHQHHCAIALGCGPIPVDHYFLQVRPWRLEAHADNVAMDYHVWVGLENVPLHAWNMHTVLRVLGSSASLDYIEPRSIRKESTDMLWVWVWTENPSRIPKVKRVTLPPRPSAVPVGGERGRRGLRHRILVHLAIVEDFTSENPPPCMSCLSSLGRWILLLLQGADVELHRLAVMIGADGATTTTTAAMDVMTESERGRAASVTLFGGACPETAATTLAAMDEVAMAGKTGVMAIVEMGRLLRNLSPVRRRWYALMRRS